MKAIIDEQLEEVLSKLGVWEALCSHKVHCTHCNKEIEIENMGIFIPRRDSDGNRIIDFYCNDMDCINAVLSSK